MKKLSLLILFLAASMTALVAQDAKPSCSSKKTSCAKTCKSKAKTASTDAEGTAVLSMAEEFAAQDENIEKRVCATSGTVSYYEKSVCEQSGKVSYNKVQFDEESKKFVNVSPNPDGKVMHGEMMKTSEVVNPRGMVEKAEVLSKKNAKCDGKEAKACCKKGEGAAKSCCTKK